MITVTTPNDVLSHLQLFSWLQTSTHESLLLTSAFPHVSMDGAPTVLPTQQWEMTTLMNHVVFIISNGVGRFRTPTTIHALNNSSRNSSISHKKRSLHQSLHPRATPFQTSLAVVACRLLSCGNRTRPHLELQMTMTMKISPVTTSPSLSPLHSLRQQQRPIGHNVCLVCSVCLPKARGGNNLVWVL